MCVSIYKKIIKIYICVSFAANTSQYAHYVFNTLDQDHSGLLSFEVNLYVQSIAYVTFNDFLTKFRLLYGTVLYIMAFIYDLIVLKRKVMFNPLFCIIYLFLYLLKLFVFSILLWKLLACIKSLSILFSIFNFSGQSNAD